MNIQQRKVRAAGISVISNTALVVLKLVVGLLIGSVSVISEAIHSGVDLVAAGIALFAVKKAAQPADDDHPYGHGKIENASGTIEGLLIFVAAGWIMYEAIKRLVEPRPVEQVAWGIAVMLVSTVLNIIVSQNLFNVARDGDSVALLADAWHLRTDVWTSAGVMVSLGVMWLGERMLPGRHFHWLDSVAALIVAVLILHAAYDLTKQSARDLLDWSLPDEEEQWIREYLAGLRSEVRGFHRLRTRKAGSRRFVDVHLLVDEDLSVRKAHDIAEQVESRIGDYLPNCSVVIHVEPSESQ